MLSAECLAVSWYMPYVVQFDWLPACPCVPGVVFLVLKGLLFSWHFNASVASGWRAVCLIYPVPAQHVHACYTYGLGKNPLSSVLPLL